MLTSLFYYEHYRPYIMKSSDSRDNRAAELRRKVVKAESDSPSEVALNKSLNKNVVNYAKGIYRNTTDLKYTSKKLSGDIRNYSKYKDRDEFNQDAFEQSFQRDLEQFSDSYNKSVKFLKNQQHSRYLDEAADRLEDIVEGSEKIISVMGLDKNQDGNITVNADKSSFWNGKNTEKKTGAAEKFFTEIYNETSEILDNPMSLHMNFKSLNYYYNYQVDKVNVDSFQIIKTGLLVNLAL